MVVAVVAVLGAGWWWQEKCTCGIIWSCTALFGRYALDGHKGPLKLIAINAIVA